MTESLKEKMVGMLGMESKLLINAYATLQSALISIAHEDDADLLSESLNCMVNVFATEIGLIDLDVSELLCHPSYEDCVDVISEKTRIAKNLIGLFFESLLDSATIDQFYIEIDRLALAQKNQIKVHMKDQPPQNVH